jgi:hypothetical protein
VGGVVGLAVIAPDEGRRARAARGGVGA